MKRLSISLGLILIVSALFLSARDLSAASPSPSPNQATPLASPSPARTPNGGAEHGDNRSGTTLTFVFLGITTAATALLAWFNWRLVGVTDEMRKATSEAAEAAKQSASAASNQLEFTRIANAQNVEIATQAAEAAKRNVEIAKLGLKTDRPYLIIEECELAGMPETGPVPCKVVDNVQSITGTVSFRNFGKGAAIVDEVVGHLVIVPKLPVPRDFVDCREMVALKAAIRPNERINVASPFVDMFVSRTQEECDAVMQGKLKLIFYGCIHYRDVFEETYETGFLWTYSPPITHPFSIGGFVVKGPAAHNYRT